LSFYLTPFYKKTKLELVLYFYIFLREKYYIVLYLTKIINYRLYTNI
jgi:hypothetical protein